MTILGLGCIKVNDYEMLITKWCDLIDNFNTSESSSNRYKTIKYVFVLSQIK